VRKKGNGDESLVFEAAAGKREADLLIQKEELTASKWEEKEGKEKKKTNYMFSRINFSLTAGMILLGKKRTTAFS